MKSTSALNFLLIWCSVMSLACFVFCAVDKAAAKSRARRIPEKSFFLLAALGGGAGLWLGMITFRHKTRHWYFWAIALLTTAAWVFLAVYMAAL